MSDALALVRVNLSGVRDTVRAAAPRLLREIAPTSFGPFACGADDCFETYLRLDKAISTTYFDLRNGASVTRVVEVLPAPAVPTGVEITAKCAAADALWAAARMATIVVVAKSWPLDADARRKVVEAIAGLTVEWRWSKGAIAAFIQAIARFAADRSAYGKIVRTPRTRCSETQHANVLRRYLTKSALDVFVDWLQHYALADAVDGTIGGASGSTAMTDQVAAVDYEHTTNGLIWRRRTAKAGTVRTPLTNFCASVVAQVIEDDGVEERRSFELEATLGARVVRTRVSTAEFASMSWVLDRLGAEAIIFAGSGLREHARVAIQRLSGRVPERRVFAHTGWRRIGDAWVYLHSGGAIGGDGAVAGVDVTLPGVLVDYALPEAPSEAARVEAIRASLHLLDLAPDTITVPLLAAVYRAVLGPADFSLYLVGPTGAFKTELAALAQQHWGVGLDARHLPGAWSGTANANEALAFAAKDALLVVDDFAPGGSAVEVQRLHREADRLLRAQGNAAGRQRMRADTSLRPAKPPRGLILSTGEDVPRGQSLRARVLVLEVSPRSVNPEKLTARQREAASGCYARAMAAYLQGLAPHYEALRQNHHGEASKLRKALTRAGAHRRSPAIGAELALGLWYFFSVARDVGAIDAQQFEVLWTRAWAALDQAGAEQAAQQRDSDPARRFLDLLAAAITAGDAHIATTTGQVPTEWAAWGWRDPEQEGGNADHTGLRAKGRRIGWLDEAKQALYLEPEASYGVAQDLARKSSEPLPVTPRTLGKRLHEGQWLVMTDTARETLTVRRTLDQRPRTVLYLHASVFEAPSPPEPDKPDKPDPSAQSDAAASSGDADGASGGRVPGTPCRVLPESAPTSNSSNEAAKTDATSMTSDAAVGNVGIVGFLEGETAGPGDATAQAAVAAPAFRAAANSSAIQEATLSTPRNPTNLTNPTSRPADEAEGGAKRWT